MADHFPDATKKMDFIRRDKVHVQIERALCEGLPYHRTIDDIPAADVVARDCYDRILAENDTMREMLARIGKKFGDSMDDVQAVRRGKWLKPKSPYSWYKCECDQCGYKAPDSGWTLEPWEEDVGEKLYNDFVKAHPFCTNCGAHMRGEKDG